MNKANEEIKINKMYKANEGCKFCNSNSKNIILSSGHNWSMNGEYTENMNIFLENALNCDKNIFEGFCFGTIDKIMKCHCVGSKLKIKIIITMISKASCEELNSRSGFFQIPLITRIIEDFELCEELIEIVSILLKFGANINLPCERSSYPIFEAIKKFGNMNDKNIVSLVGILLDAGADITVFNSEHKTPREILDGQFTKSKYHRAINTMFKEIAMKKMIEDIEYDMIKLNNKFDKLVMFMNS